MSVSTVYLKHDHNNITCSSGVNWLCNNIFAVSLTSGSIVSGCLSMHFLKIQIFNERREILLHYYTIKALGSCDNVEHEVTLM